MADPWQKSIIIIIIGLTKNCALSIELKSGDNETLVSVERVPQNFSLFFLFTVNPEKVVISRYMDREIYLSRDHITIINFITNDV